MDNKKEKRDTNINLANYNEKEKGALKKFIFGLWFLKNRRNFFISLISLLFLSLIILYIYLFYNVYDYLKYSPDDKMALEELSIIGVNLGSSRVAEPLQNERPLVFFHNDSYDFVARVKNPNLNFFASINYCFLDGDEELLCQNDIVFPEENKYLVVLSVELDSAPNNLRFMIKNLSWERVDAKKYSNWKNYYSERVNFDVSNIVFNISQSTDIYMKSVNNLSFNIKNNSPYNYWEVPLSIILYSQGSIVGVNKYLVSEFMSLTDKNIELFWSNSVRSVDQAEIVPNLNILDNDNYIKYQ
ncbi:MAG: hypothetical protein WC928_00295 [Patescibacteria group bacterium]|jgi:hypothetical protein